MTQAANTGLAWRNLLVAGAVVLASLPAQASAAALSAGVNVKDYGAVGDGITDDDTAMANALASGRSVLFPARTYLTAAQSISSAGQILFGEGAASVIKAATAATRLFTVAADNVCFADLRLNGVATSNTGSNNAQYANCVQPFCAGNIIIGNSVSNCALSGNPSSGAIGVYGQSSRVLISSNIVKNSGGKGVAIDGAGITDCADTVIDGNTVTNSSLIGIDVIAGVRDSVSNNPIRQSSLASAGVSSNIRLVSDGATASSGISILDNNSSGPVYSRSAFQFNATVPVPFNLTVTGNRFEACNLTTVELGGVPCAIDGRLRYSVTITPPSLAKGTSYSLSGLSLPGAVPGDTLAWSYRGYSGNCKGFIMTVAITPAGSAQYVIANLSTGTKKPTAGTLDIDVFKRKY